MYGYSDSNQRGGSSFNFGLNAGVAKLIKFEHTLNGGKDGAELEALDIVFDVNGREVSYRQFPVTRAYGENNMEFTSPEASPEAREAFAKAGKDFNSKITHILECFVTTDTIKQAMGSGVSTFQEYCNICQGLLPADYSTRPLDIFMQYQWNIKGDNDRTYLEIPKSTKYGPFLSPAVEGNWSEVRADNPSDSMSGAIKYTDSDGNVHPFRRNGWYANSNFANGQSDEASDAQQSIESSAPAQSAF